MSPAPTLAQFWEKQERIARLLLEELGWTFEPRGAGFRATDGDHHLEGETLRATLDRIELVAQAHVDKASVCLLCRKPSCGYCAEPATEGIHVRCAGADVPPD
jgi:hypothetical protein